MLLALLLILPLSQTLAATKATTPDPASTPALAALLHSGAKFYYLGRYADMDGWLALKDGQLQTIYRPTNSAYAITGNLFAPNGDSLTAAQVKKLTSANPELAAMVASETKSAPPPSSPPLAAAPKDGPSESSLPAGECFMKELDRTGGVTLGAKDGAPLLYVLVSPACEACKTFWQSLREPVQKGALRVRLFPAGIKDSEDERASAQLLLAADPLAAWDKFAGGDVRALTGAPVTPSALNQVRATTALIERWNLPTAPYSLYRAKDGQVKVVQGLPGQPQAVLDDIAPAKPETKP